MQLGSSLLLSFQNTFCPFIGRCDNLPVTLMGALPTLEDKIRKKEGSDR